MGGSGTCRSELAPGGVPTMDVNDDEGCRDERGALEFFASKLAPTLQWVHQVVGDQSAVINHLTLQQ